MRDSSFDTDILDMTTDLCIGERSDHLVCPCCRGGDSGERSLLVWCHADGLAYRCYRVKCGLSGKIGQSGYRPVSTKMRKPKCHTRQLHPEPLPNDVLDWYLDYFWWADAKMLRVNGVLWDETTERILYPIKSMTGTHEGYLARRYDDLVLDKSNFQGGKAKAYYNSLPTDYKMTCMMTPLKAQFDEWVVVVEDYPSAMRINTEIPCVALSGTSIQDATLMELVRAGKRKVCFVLDADATSKAASMVYNYGLHFEHLTFVPLFDADPKDMEDEDFDDLVDTIRRQLDV
ncbi:DNA primase [Vibrio phage VpV262]|uniref:DNA primase n=1 Tax=Vibrio phage VpV262 TaxID=2907796 RepID=Q8LTT8_9CAUD|nr:DNA primase [Vibrio phage VpV262]AAM28363.1 DNA primase [Vibrio phage VpV262]